MACAVPACYGETGVTEGVAAATGIAARAASGPSAPDNLRGWHRIYEIPAGAGRLLPMEGARGLAVLLVFFVHFHALFGHYAEKAALLWAPSKFLGLIGNTGVDLFFVISGYLIYAALIRRSTGFARFIGRRVQRIYPTFLAVLCIYLVLSALFPEANRIHGSFRDAAAYVLANVLLLPGVFQIPPIITVAWSLSYEFAFYLALPAVVWATRMWRWKPGWRAVFFSAVWALYMGWAFSASRSHVRTLMFVMGILLYEARPRLQRTLGRRGEAAAIAAFLASMIFAYLIDAQPALFSWLPGWRAGRDVVPGVLVYQGPYKTMALSASCFWLAAYAFQFRGWLNRICCWTPLRCLGNMSYSYYLIHGVTLQGVSLAFVLMGARQAQPLWWAAGLVIGLAATWTTSTALFALVERPASLQRRSH